MRIDFHCHPFQNIDKTRMFNLFSLNFEGYGFFERIVEKLTEISTIESESIKEKTIFHIRRANIQKVVLLPVSSKENERVLKWREFAPDVFLPFFNPPEKDVIKAEVSKSINKAFSEGVYKGFKVMLSFRKKKLNNEIIHPVLEIAESKNLPVLMHTGYPPPGTKRNVLSYSNPIVVDQLMESFPKVKIVLAHMGYPWTDIAIALAVQYPNIYLDISNMSYMMPLRLKELLLSAKDIIGTRKILFGTDGFVPEMIEIASNFFENCDYLTQQDVENIMGKNAKKLLNL